MLLRLISQYFINKEKAFMSQKYKNTREKFCYYLQQSQKLLWRNHTVINTEIPSEH